MDGKQLLILAHVQADMGFTRYGPGDVLPNGHPDAAAWVEAGAAKWIDKDYSPPAYAKATPAAAVSGLYGSVVGGESDQCALVGRIPNTCARRRRNV